MHPTFKPNVKKCRIAPPMYVHKPTKMDSTPITGMTNTLLLDYVNRNILGDMYRYNILGLSFVSCLFCASSWNMKNGTDFGVSFTC